MKKKAIGQAPRKGQKNTPHLDPLHKAIQSAESDFWTMRPPEDIRRMVARAIEKEGRDKGFWVFECVRAGLAKYAGKKDGAPVLLKPQES